MAGGDGADTIKNVFATKSTRDRVNHDVSIGQDIMYRLRYGIGNLLRTLEGHIAGEPDGQIGSIPVPGAANGQAVHFEQAIDFPGRRNDLVADALGRSVE